MNRKTLGVDIQADSVVDQHYRDKQQEEYEYTDDEAYPFKIGIEKLHQRLLVHHIIHRRISIERLLDNGKTVSRYIIRRYLKLQRRGNWIDLKDIHEILTQNLLHLLHPFFLGDDLHVFYISRTLQFIGKRRGIRIVSLN